MRNSITPLMQQYRDIKARYPGMILFFRLGDFYEMFGEDAVKAAPLLDVVLTRRQDLPMCGVPYHAVNGYLSKLIRHGEKVAVCEQLEEPGAGRGIVKRDVVRVITPGTLLEDNLLEAKQNNFLVALEPGEGAGRCGLACVDISTGEFTVTELDAAQVKSEVSRLSPREIVVAQSRQNHPLFAPLSHDGGITVSALDDWHFSVTEAESKLRSFFKVQSVKPLGLEDRVRAACAAGGILAYLEKTQKGALPPLTGIRYYSLDAFLLLDATAVRNLELVEGLTTRSEENSLLETIDMTLTPLGARCIRRWLLQPLLELSAILERQRAVEFFVEEGMARRRIRETLRTVADLERILGRVATGTATPRELVSLKNSLAALPGIMRDLTENAGGLAVAPSAVNALTEQLAPPEEVIRNIERSIVEEPPAVLKDGGVIRAGVSPELDELRRIRRDSKDLIARMETAERQRTGIASLKIGYTSVFGYYIEVSKSNLHLVPQEYVRKQTVASGERFITPELKTFEEKILSAEEKILRLEEELFRGVRNEVLRHAGTIQRVASAVAALDVFAALAETAAIGDYCKPRLDESRELDIRDGRHPVIERRLKSGGFVANDAYLNGTSDQIILLTGPNMAGKSTYLRQVALIVIMAQMGSFVPAASARIGVVDRIFTRIGAGDNLSGGESTFMVEMHETASILNQHTPRSLIILDEVGRGTSTYDGISIAWSAVEYLAAAKKKHGFGPKVLFATHYFELTELQGTLDGVKNCNVAVKEWQGEVVFLHKILPGAADRSYGIHVAQLAGLPTEVIARAHRILADLEQKAAQPAEGRGNGQLDFFSLPSTEEGPLPAAEILIELGKLDLNAITPLEAMQFLSEWKTKLKT